MRNYDHNGTLLNCFKHKVRFLMSQSFLSKISIKALYTVNMLCASSCLSSLFAFASLASEHKETTLPGRNVVDYTPGAGISPTPEIAP